MIAKQKPAGKIIPLGQSRLFINSEIFHEKCKELKAAQMQASREIKKR